MNEKVNLDKLHYEILLKRLEIYEKKLQDINDISTDLATFNPTYEKIRKLSEINLKNS